MHRAGAFTFEQVTSQCTFFSTYICRSRSIGSSGLRSGVKGHTSRSVTRLLQLPKLSRGTARACQSRKGVATMASSGDNLEYLCVACCMSLPHHANAVAAVEGTQTSAPELVRDIWRSAQVSLDSKKNNHHVSSNVQPEKVLEEIGNSFVILDCRRFALTWTARCKFPSPIQKLSSYTGCHILALS